MTKMFIKPNQSRLVKYFKRYTVNSDEEEPEQQKEQMSAKDLLNGFQPEKDEVDRLIKCEILDVLSDSADEADDENGINLMTQSSRSHDHRYSLIN